MNNKKCALESNRNEPKIIVKKTNYDSAYDPRVTSRNNYFEILLYKIGNCGRHIIDFKEYEITNGSVFIITPGRVHLLKQNPEENGIIIQFTKEFLELSILPSQLDWFLKFYANPKVSLDSFQSEKLYFYFEKIKELYDSSSILKFQKLQKLFGLILFKLLEFIPDQVRLYKKESVSYEFMSLVIEKFREIRLVKKYAALLNIPINKLEKEVKMHYGKSPLKIINELLVIEIKRLLISNKLSHKEISFALNFDSQSSYTRFIKTHTGKTPTELKKTLMF
ncbi:AraC family transcriptional regulator [Flavivirga spongiicola]|uniref:Helix-turn-helix transcriptional regulator n=1 Tax=Flavivirga spongiicola TaxID=421621 RepID=A0ABU7XY97_9FLAO|nr:helix-turn-helix transcriptional regulator [Flavivirga sp. MEBiC05379]MDO5980375.1 helix-turn-helix transcriptional regulator [Flavivirga sp. MEBiC05379]